MDFGIFSIMGLWDFKKKFNGFWDFYHGTNKGPRGAFVCLHKS
jgi:hypothetical protein